MRFVELHVEGYRSLVDVSVPLRPLTVMIGPNGSGKTALLEVVQLLKDATQENLGEALEKLGGLNAVFSRIHDGPNRLRIALTVDVESTLSQEPMYYRFELAPRDVGYVIPFERLEWQLDPRAPKPYRYIDARYEDVHYAEPDISGMVRPTWDYHDSELALAQVPRMYEAPEALRSALSKTHSFSFLDVRQRSVVRLPQSLTPTTRPGPNGESLYSALYNLRALYPDSYAQIEEVLQIGFPGFRHLEFPVVGAGQVTMAWYEDPLTSPLYPGELSEGTLRFLWLTTILLSPRISPIVLIDEPEVSLHPELLKLLAGLLQDAAARQQIIVATHSPDLVRWLQPDEVLVLDKAEGRTRFTWADSLDLGEWLKEYTLRDLWLMGTLGGRP
jgi:predicted ATPase